MDSLVSHLCGDYVKLKNNQLHASEF